ncbi:MAG: DUF29 domain-containing protein [Leptolyngbyaceae cyanobacterium bins.302]|nr:DUF29 domain-containing protein [Leptolyngbyaceae cyanobacterium bins.302]
MAAQVPETSLLHQLYEQDYFCWLNETARLLRSGDLAEIDRENLAEEIEDMGRSEKRSLESNLEIVLMHLLKYQYQPERLSNSWRSTLFEHRKRLRKTFKESPSLKNYFLEVFEECYQDARQMAALETELAVDIFPEICQFTPEETLGSDFLPD